MRSGTPGFKGGRLAQARDARGLTQVALAALVRCSSSSISRWEKDEQSPEPQALAGLATELEVPVAFFLRPVRDGDLAATFFHSMAATTQSLRRRTRARLRWAQEIALSLQEWVELPQVNVPSLSGVTDYRKVRQRDIEAMATECRALWELGEGPVADVLLVLENAGVVVVKEEVGSVRLDGLSGWSAADGRPYVLIARDRDTCVRCRMQAARELGHLVLHRGVDPKAMYKSADLRELESQAFDFAAAFLMPAESFAAEVSTPSLNAFLALKERWRTPIAAMIRRAARLHILSKEYERRLWKHYSSKGWRKIEPLDEQLDGENPRLLARSVQLLVDEKVRDRRSLLTDFRLQGKDVEALCGLQPGYMSADLPEAETLPKLKRSVRSVDGGGSGST